MIVYDPFWVTLKMKNISTYKLTKYYHVSNGTLYRMRKGKALTTVTINDLCNILQCRVEDIIEHIPDKEPE